MTGGREFRIVGAAVQKEREPKRIWVRETYTPADEDFDVEAKFKRSIHFWRLFSVLVDEIIIGRFWKRDNVLIVIAKYHRYYTVPLLLGTNLQSP